eukprot:12412839-Karenia_brevis.AAC.1
MVLLQGPRKPRKSWIKNRVASCIGFAPGRLRALNKTYSHKGICKNISDWSIRKDIDKGFLINKAPHSPPMYTHGKMDIDKIVRFRNCNDIYNALTAQRFSIARGIKKVSAASKASPDA